MKKIYQFSLNRMDEEFLPEILEIIPDANKYSFFEREAHPDTPILPKGSVVTFDLSKSKDLSIDYQVEFYQQVTMDDNSEDPYLLISLETGGDTDLSIKETMKWLMEKWEIRTPPLPFA